MTDARFGPGCASVPADGKGSFAGLAKEPVATAASNNPLLSTLVAAVKKAGLVDTLNNSKNITVFAPSNSAFDKIPKADLDKVLADKTTLTHLLTHHVVPSRLAPAALAGTHPTLNSDSVVSGTTPDFDVVGAKDHRGGQRDDLAGGLYESSGDFGGAGGANPQPAHPEGGASVDPHLAKLTPVVLVDGLADDLRRRGEVGRQLGLGGLEVVAVDVRATGIAVAERLDEDVFVAVVQAARPFEPQAALLGARGLGEGTRDLGPGVGVLGTDGELGGDEDQGVSPQVAGMASGVVAVCAQA